MDSVIKNLMRSQSTTKHGGYSVEQFVRIVDQSWLIVWETNSDIYESILQKGLQPIKEDYLFWETPCHTTKMTQNLKLS